MLGAGEDQGAGHVVVLEQLGQQLELVGRIDMDDALVDALDGGGDGRHFDAHRIGQQAAGKAGDLLRHGGREEQVLALLRQHAGDLADGVDEAQVEHLVDFVEDEDFDLGERQGAALDEIDEAARRCDEDIDAAAQDFDLLADRDAAENHGAGDLQVAAIGLEAFGDLRGELAGGREDEGPAGVLGRALGCVRQALKHGQREGCGLAGAGLGDAEKIAARQQFGNGAGLDGGGLVVAFGGDGLEDGAERLSSENEFTV